MGTKKGFSAAVLVARKVFAMLVLIGVLVGGFAMWQGDTAYQRLVADHPLRPVVGAVEATPYALVFGYEYITNPGDAEDVVAVLWLYFDEDGTEEGFIEVHEIALCALVEAFPGATNYMLVWAVPGDAGEARGMSAMWVTPVGASVALQSEDYVEGMKLAIQHGEAGHVPMRDYGYPAMEGDWYPRPEGYTWPWEGEGGDEQESV
jgi:hypothetical protein